MTPAQLDHIRIAAEALASARVGTTDGRIISEDQHRRATGALIALLKEEAGEKDEYPAVSWRTSREGFGEWHRQTAANVTKCGTPVPDNCILAHGIATTVRPVEGCRKCWAEEPAGVGSMA